MRRLLALFLIAVIVVSIAVPVSIWLLGRQTTENQPTDQTEDNELDTRGDILVYSQQLLAQANEIYVINLNWQLGSSVWALRLEERRDAIVALGQQPNAMTESVQLMLDGIEKSRAAMLGGAGPYTPSYYEAMLMYDEAVQEWAAVLTQYNIALEELTPYQDSVTLEQGKTMLENEIEEWLAKRDPPGGAQPPPSALETYNKNMSIVSDWYDKNKLGAAISLGFGVTADGVPLILPPLAPNAEFSASPRSGDAPLTVQFTDQSTGDITSWAWDFDDDGTVDSTEQNPSHTYTTLGIYTVELSVTGPGGTSTGSMSDYITVN